MSIQTDDFNEQRIIAATPVSPNEEAIERALRPHKLDEYVGEKATNLSGGQRQRLALARAMLTRPLFLVLDEATSALDSETESLVSRSILEMKGETTLLVVAHRLSTVRMADRIIYLEGGKVLCEGSFEEVRMAVPNFDVQAKLMGL